MSGAALVAPVPAVAQDAPPIVPATAQAPAGLPASGDVAPPVATTNGKQVYEVAAFARFAPRSALDMVRQIPGFVIRQSADDRRGFGQATGNVLIDGERISGKSNDAEAALGRINAGDVVSIEILDGARLDIPGLSGQVVNVVTAVKGLSGNFRWLPQIRSKNKDPRLFAGEVSVTGKSGPVDYTLSLSGVARRVGESGPEIARNDKGVIDDYRDEAFFINEDQPRIAGAFKYQGADGSIGNLNLSYERFYSTVTEDSLQRFPGRADRLRDYRATEREWNYEVGGDFESDLGGGRLKLIGLRRFEASPYRQRFWFDYADGAPRTGTRFTREADEGESILRSEYRWKGGAADWQISAEGAINTLDTRAGLAEIDNRGVFQPVPLPGGTLKIEEKRAEFALSYGRPIAPGLTLQSSIGGEYSRLAQDGAGGLTRSFFRPKGFVSLAWKPNPLLDISARIEREIGQLNFFDFAASMNVGIGVGNSANPDLRPPQSWNAELEVSRNLGIWGSVKARVFGKRISDVVVQVPIGPRGEAPGNIDRATEYGLDWTSTLNFDPLGWKGAKLDMVHFFRGSRVRDPLTKQMRSMSDVMAHELDFKFRHDIPASSWAWGVDYYHYRETEEVRLNQRSQYVSGSGQLGAYVENKNIFGLTVRAGLYNLLNSKDRFARTVYQVRRDGPVAYSEDRTRTYDLTLDFRISGSF